MAPEKDQNSEWTASNEVDWDKSKSFAWEIPSRRSCWMRLAADGNAVMTTMTQSWRELTPEQQKAKSQFVPCPKIR